MIHRSLIRSRRPLSLAALIVSACLSAPAAWAHAFLEKASPPVGSVVSSAPASLSLTYTEAVEPFFSRVRVTSAAGARMDTGKLTTGQGGRLVEVPLRAPLPPGRYTVTWHMTSVDTHKTQGRFTFRVKP